MSDVFTPRPLPRDALARLVASVNEPGFADRVLAHLREAAPVANMGAFYVADMAQPRPVLSLWSGEMSGYWFNRNARRILSHDLLQADILARIRAAPPGGLALERWHPDADDPRLPIYRRDGVIERLTVSSRSGRSGVLSFYLRGRDDGWFSARDMDRLAAVLPLAHELIGLRHRVTGSEAFHFSGQASASGLRERDVGGFGTLSAREAEACDHVIRGLSVAGTALELAISENTVRTLRRRAYRKLGVNSATQIVALVLNDRG
ncbi:LuxR C-terminal-related transcriptional regulator [Seohaeicola saemankumensis]|nr:LuxR C-terminal-related transcriptional regulator [Seohaeicola saemankumensis]MCA0873255.1 LuxR C-terminal-related transcriptional regulator [Seohaeicola saemankumensis]